MAAALGSAIYTSAGEEDPRNAMRDLPNEVWLQIGMSLDHAPHAIFRLMMTNRLMRTLFSPIGNGQQQGDWWRIFFERVCAYQSRLKHSRFIKRILACHDRFLPFSDNNSNHDVPPSMYAVILRCIFSPRCEGCGARFGHRVLLPFAVRVCARCLRAQSISNHALELHFGVEFPTFLDRYMLTGGLLVPIDAFPSHRNRMGQAIARLSNQPCDLRLVRAPTSAQRKLVFFWRPDVESALGASLQQMVPMHALRLRAAKLLTAAVRRCCMTRFFLRVMSQTAPLCPDVIGVARGTIGRIYQSTRTRMPLEAHPPDWIPGVGAKRRRAEHAQRIVNYTSHVLSPSIQAANWFPKECASSASTTTAAGAAGKKLGLKVASRI